MAWALYIVQIWIGVCIVFGLAQGKPGVSTFLAASIGSLGTIMGIGGLTAVYALIMMTLDKSVRTALGIELAGAVLIAVANSIIVIGINAGGGGPIGLGYALTVGAGAWARVVQIIFDIRRYKRALKVAILADPLLAEIEHDKT
jgi:hypothetical protein